jgi:hypothetical protein
VESDRPKKTPATNDGTTMINRCVVDMGLSRAAKA